MRRWFALVVLCLVGCGGKPNEPRYTQVLEGGILGTTERIATTAMGVDSDGAPVLGYTLELGHTAYVATATGKSSFDIPTQWLPGPAFNAGDCTVIGAGGDGSYVYDRRTKTGRWVDYVGPADADGEQILWQRWDGQVSVENVATGERADVPLVVRDRTLDWIIDFRNGHILFLKDLDPTHESKSPLFAYQVLALDGTVLATLKMPEGAYAMQPSCLNAKGEVGGIAAVGNEVWQPVRWSAEGDPTLLSSQRSFRVAGLTDDGRLIVGPDYSKGTMRLVSETGEVDLGIRVNGRQVGHAEGGYLFLRQDLPDSAAVYRLP